jgi:hypothetical protein
MQSTNKVSESNNRSTNRFLSYKEIPVVIDAHDVLRFCRLELNQLQGIRTAILFVQCREIKRQHTKQRVKIQSKKFILKQTYLHS